MECGLELPEYCIDAFGVEVDILLKATMRSRLVEQISTALNRELFDGNGAILAVEDHKSVTAVHGFLQVSESCSSLKGKAIDVNDLSPRRC